jgi:hypothetical protein
MMAAYRKLSGVRNVKSPERVPKGGATARLAQTA